MPKVTEEYIIKKKKMKLRLLIEIKINFFQSCKPIIVD